MAQAFGGSNPSGSTRNKTMNFYTIYEVKIKYHYVDKSNGECVKISYRLFANKTDVTEFLGLDIASDVKQVDVSKKIYDFVSLWGKFGVDKLQVSEFSHYSK